MKVRILTLFLTLGLVICISCNNDDDSSQNETLIGSWNLKTAKAGLLGIDEDFETGIITWAFNNQNLTVVNNTTDENSYSGYESGTYSYSIVESNGNSYITINNAEVGKYILSKNNLTINENELQSGSGNDGFILAFER
ncbi:hypothetical protein LX77_03201 [Gelidibacter algens]|uniref:Lipocalin-like protein n=1 Tax=Gelidibacter algens TaxID=49280 RepID=A0A1A7QQ19_9FLAO|nr:hypothetical protein [Gelidibacter algens]OBX22155.1 hypothetical protein A9996_17255 [Gelidibacter algens]RAJ19987.1 hypothetical protein LX77_03201 [Gelidibacter algens]